MHFCLGAPLPHLHMRMPIDVPLAQTTTITLGDEQAPRLNTYTNNGMVSLVIRLR